MNYPIIIKNVLSDHTFFSLNDEFKIGWQLTNLSYPKNSSNNTTKSEERLSWTLTSTNGLIIFKCASIIKLKIQKYLKTNINFIRAHINGHTFGQCGQFHIDYDEDDVWTFVFFCSPLWDVNWGGEFVFFDPENKEYRYVPYIPNTGCLIPANWEHFGSSPNEKTDKLRTTIGFSFCTDNIFDTVKKYKSTYPFI